MIKLVFSSSRYFSANISTLRQRETLRKDFIKVLSQSFSTSTVKLGNSNSSSNMSAELKANLDKQIAEHKVFVISKSYCPYCVKAKDLFGKMNLPDYKVWDIENEPEMDAIQDYMLSLTGGRSVPRVFINGKFVGGCDDTCKYSICCPLFACSF